jgi:hypothetical protein
MTMRADLAFATPLSADDEVRLRLALGTLPQVRRTVVAPTRRHVTLYAVDVALDSIRAAMAESGLSPERIATSLSPEADLALHPPAGELVRPIGR